MDIEKEFMGWLQSTKDSFGERLIFAAKAWQSLEFTYANKYELILSWMSQELESPSLSLSTLPTVELGELLRLRAHPGLITRTTKTQFVKVLLKFASQLSGVITGRRLCDLLKSLLCSEVLQDVFRADFELVLKVYAALCRNYETYQQQQILKVNLDIAQESEFFNAVLRLLQDHIKRSHNISDFDKYYTTHLLQPLVEVLLTLRTHGLCFDEEFATIEQLLTQGNINIIDRIYKQPLHVRLLALECAIVNLPGDSEFQYKLLQHVFYQSDENELQEPRQLLLAAAFTLEILRKHGIPFTLVESEKETVLSMVSRKLIGLIRDHKEQYLRDVLLLLCAAMRLNPLLLEQDIFQITTWMIIAPKNTEEEQLLYEQYAVLLMDMFRRLSRAERFLGSLLKVLKEWLSQYELPNIKIESKGKRTAKSTNEEQATPSKCKKLSNAQTFPLEPHATAEITNTTAAYLAVLFQELLTSKRVTNEESGPAVIKDSFPALKMFWPSVPVGSAFSKLVANLMSKPSMVIWSTLLHELKKLLDETTETELDDNTLFAFDLQASLLCQYFRGSRIAEQSQKFVSQLSAHVVLTKEVLGQFGRFLLAREHNQRTIKAFFECCYYAGAFELLLAYYMSDGPTVTAAESTTALTTHLHGYISDAEWTLMQQRVLNFGKRNCKQLYDRLQLQRAHAKYLLLKDATANADPETMLPVAHLDIAQLLCMLPPYQARFVVRKLTGNDKLALIEAQDKSDGDAQKIANVIIEDLGLLELLAKHMFATYARQLETNNISGSMSMALHEATLLDDMMATQPKNLASKLNEQVENDKVHLNGELPLEQVTQLLARLRPLPLSHLRRTAKSIIFLHLMALYYDLSTSKAKDLAAATLDYILDFLHFGTHVTIFKCFTSAQLLTLLPVHKCLPLYKLLLNQYVLQEDKGYKGFLSSLAEAMQMTNVAKLSEAQRQLLLLVIEILGGLSGPRAKRIQQQMTPFVAVFARYIKAHFQYNNEAATADATATFVQQTLPAYAIYVKVSATNSNSAVIDKVDTVNQYDADNVIDEDFRRICKIYIGHSLDYRNPYSLRLMNVALNHRQQLHFDQDEIELVLSSYWHQLNKDLGTTAQSTDAKCLESAIELIIGNKTNEDLLLTLRELNASVQQQQDLRHASNVLALLTLIAKCGFSTIKAAIFNEHFKHLTTQIVLQMPRPCNHDLIVQLHACQFAIIENKTVPLSADTLDSILDSMLELNVKKLSVADEVSRKQTMTLHASVSELCMALLKQRTYMMMDRVPQLMHILKSQLQAIVWYKSEPQKAAMIVEAEMDELANLALKLATLMRLIVATLAVAVKRVAPFVLTFIINLMVANKRPTTLYQKIKLHIESICYDLIGLCDHRVGNFILRSSNEAGRELYKLLHADHKKYYKFKGKV